MERSCGEFLIERYGCLFNAVISALEGYIETERGPVSTKSLSAFSFRSSSGEIHFNSFGALLTEAANLMTEHERALAELDKYLGGEESNGKVISPIGVLKIAFNDAGTEALYKMSEAKGSRLKKQANYHYHLSTLKHLPKLQNLFNERTANGLVLAELCDQIWGELPPKVSQLMKIKEMVFISSDGANTASGSLLLERLKIDDTPDGQMRWSALRHDLSPSIGASSKYRLRALSLDVHHKGAVRRALTVSSSRDAIFELCHQVWGGLPEKVEKLKTLDGAHCQSPEGGFSIEANELFDTQFIDIKNPSKACQKRWNELRSTFKKPESSIEPHYDDQTKIKLSENELRAGIDPGIDKRDIDNLLRCILECALQACGEVPEHLTKAEWEQIQAAHYVDSSGHTTCDKLLRYYVLEYDLSAYRDDQPLWPRLSPLLLGIYEKNRPLKPNPKQLYDELADAPGLLFHILTNLGWEKDTKKAFDKVKARLKDGEFRVKPQEGTESKKEPIARLTPPVHLYAKALEQALAADNKVNLEEIALQGHCDILVFLCLHQHAGDFDKLLEELHTSIPQLTANLLPGVREKVEAVLKKVVPKVEETFKKCQSLLPPDALRKVPFQYQVLAVVEALYQGKRINGMETGLGKTLVSIIICELMKFEQIMWVTAAANCDDVKGEILDSLELTEPQVKIVPSDAASTWSVTELEEYFKGVKYLICPYTTLVQAFKTNREVYEYLCKWTKPEGGLVVDEAHEFDNHKSKRSQAVSGICAKWRYLVTATPWQHNFRNIATLIHMVDKENYPNLHKLQEMCRDKVTAQFLLKRYVSVAFADSVAKPIKPPSEEPYRIQFSRGVPLMPRPLYHPVIKVELPRERAIEYLALALSPDEWLNERRLIRISAETRKFRSLRQLAYLHQILYQPEALGLGKALELSDAVKQIGLSAMRRDEKIFIGCQNTPAVDLFCEDPELRSFGTVRLDGQNSPAERAILRHQFEEVPDIRCAVGQFKASGSGSNFRSASHVIYVQYPQVFNQYLQFRGRALRILGPNDERFAREHVNIYHIAHCLPKNLTELFTDPRLQKLIGRGTLTEQTVERIRVYLEDFEFLMRRGRLGESAADGVFTYLKAVVDAANSGTKGSTLHILSKAGRSKSPLVDYDNPIKEDRHRVPQRDFVRRHEALVRPKNTKAIVLVSHQLLDLPKLDEMGYLRHNMVLVNGGSILERALVHYGTLETGCECYTERLERIVRFIKDEFSLIAVDRDGPVTPSDVESFSRLRSAPYAVIAKNALRQRESGKAKDILHRVNPNGSMNEKRDKLDQVLLALVSTAHNHPLGDLAGVSMIKLHEALSEMSAKWGERLQDLLGEKVEAKDIESYISGIYLGSPIVLEHQPLFYLSPKGRPLGGFFALTKRVNASFRETPAALFSREVALHALRNVLDRDDTGLIDHQYSLGRVGSRLVAGFSGKTVAIIGIKEFIAQVKAYKSLALVSEEEIQEAQSLAG